MLVNVYRFPRRHKKTGSQKRMNAKMECKRGSAAKWEGFLFVGRIFAWDFYLSFPSVSNTIMTRKKEISNCSRNKTIEQRAWPIIITILHGIKYYIWERIVRCASPIVEAEPIQTRKWKISAIILWYLFYIWTSCFPLFSEMNKSASYRWPPNEGETTTTATMATTRKKNDLKHNAT